MELCLAIIGFGAMLFISVGIVAIKKQWFKEDDDA